MTKRPEIWNVGYRFNDKTGTKRPWEVVNTVHDAATGNRIWSLQWTSCATEEGAIKSIKRSFERAAKPENAKIYAEAGITLKSVGRI